MYTVFNNTKLFKNMMPTMPVEYDALYTTCDAVADYLIKQIKAWSNSGPSGLFDIFQAKRRATPHTQYPCRGATRSNLSLPINLILHHPHRHLTI
jgi:hypothetical protein